LPRSTSVCLDEVVKPATCVLRPLTRRQLLQLAGGSALVMLGGCGLGDSKPLRIAIQPWAGYQFMSLAEKAGWLPPGVQLVYLPTAVASIQSVQRGDVHGAALTLDQAMVIVDQGIALDIVLITNVSAGADVLLVRPEITQLADLRGKRIGVEATSLGAFLLAKVLQAAGLERKDVQVVDMTEDHVDSWQSQPMDALLTYEPALGELKQLGLVPLFDTRSLPGAVLDVLAIRRDAIGDHGDDVRALVAGHFRALQEWRTNPLDVAHRLAPLMQVPVERVGEAFMGLDLPDLDFNRHYLEGPSPELLQTTADIAGTMRQAGMLRSDIATDGLFTASYLPAT
jgi:NitT/TauT family transport system substrate-binding protein